MLHIEHVSYGYEQTLAINDISLHIADGENICIVGPNGCGKSTLLKAITGLVDYSGRICIGDKDLKKFKRKEVANTIAFMSQVTSVYFPYTVFETVMLGRYSKYKPSVFSSYTKDDTAYVNDCLQAVNIYHLKDRPITELSGGELQRVFLAKAFAQDPQIILLDEPTNHLDLKNQIELIEYLKKWSHNSDKIVIAVLHDINLALTFAEKILLLSNGQQVAYDSKDVILKSNHFNEVYGLNVKKYMLASYEQWNI